MGVVNWPSPCPQLNKPPAPARLTTANPVVAVGHVFAAPVPLLAQSKGGLAAGSSRPVLSPPVDPASMKFEGGVAATFMAATTRVITTHGSSAAKRAG